MAPLYETRLLMSLRVAPLVLAGIRPWLTQIMPCCIASANMVLSVDSLSPLRPALLVKPAASLSFQAWANHCLLDASANFLNCQLTLAM